MEKSCDLGNEVRDSGRAGYLITHNKGKEPVIPSNVDTPLNDELSLASSPLLGLSPAKNIRPSRVKGPLIALSSAMLLVMCPTEQGEKQVGGRGQGPVPARPSPQRLVGNACRSDAINAVCTSRLRQRANILHAASSSNSGTWRHALLGPRATHS